MQLTANYLFQLYAVSEKVENGKHKLEAFDASIDAYNEPIDEDELGDTLSELACALCLAHNNRVCLLPFHHYTAAA